MIPIDTMKLASEFPRGMTPRQKAGIDAIIASWQRHMPGNDHRPLAYALATAHHETAGRMAPVRETLAATDAMVIDRLDRAFASGRLGQVSKPYWRRDAAGKAWYGRGFVQLTHRENYRRLSAATSIDLMDNPDRALDTGIAADILVIGMADGLFTGKKVGDFFSDTRADWIGARAMINGSDRASRIAALGLRFHAALTHAASSERDVA